MATNSELLDKLMDGEIKLHELDTDEANEIRLKFLETRLNIGLENLRTNLNQKICKSNIENMIGAVQVPLGIAGPLKIKGETAKGEFYIPLATTEGALVASVNRGCKAINLSGGADAVIIKNEQTRSIQFKLSSINDLKRFMMWCENNFNNLKQAAQENEKFLELNKIELYVVGLNVWLRIHAYTNDAMGMNMVTIAGKKIAEYILKNYQDIEFISETGNMCTDKKPSAMNLINSRGKRVIASVDLDEKVLKDVFKITPEQLIDINYRKNLLGSAAAASLGFNAHFANIIAAIFIATGQDAAHVVDGSLGFTTVEKTRSGVNFCVTLADLQVGAVGGGTVLPGQKECLMILSCLGAGKKPGDNSKKLAEIIAAAVLAGELSLLCALCTKDLSNAHIKHNR